MHTERMHTERSNTERMKRARDTERMRGRCAQRDESSGSSRTKELVCIIKEQVWRMNIYLKLQQPERWQELKKCE
jgi:hypothetical protein